MKTLTETEYLTLRRWIKARTCGGGWHDPHQGIADTVPQQYAVAVQRARDDDKEVRIYRNVVTAAVRNGHSVRTASELGHEAVLYFREEFGAEDVVADSEKSSAAT